MVVAAGIIANGVTQILKKLSSVVADEITLVWDFKDELKNLQSTLNMILDVMEDAEKKQVSQVAVRRWMEELKAIAYDAEDVLDDYSYEVIAHKRQKEEYKSMVFNKVCNIFSCSKPSFVVSWKLANKVKKINEKFNKIAKRNNDLGLQTIYLGSSSSSSSQDELMMMNRETNSFSVEDWKFVGRENDKSNIIKMLLEEEEEENSTNNQSDGGKHVSVIPIMGMGGLGKTTMAQQVYNDEAVQKHFELKIWICVSDPFDIKKLWQNIGKSIREKSKESKEGKEGKESKEGKEYDNAKTMDAIAQLLQDDIKGKKFILVLDDVWNEKPMDWRNFKKPFMVGLEGSKILVTTRNEKVALIMVDKFKPYPLGILKENDCWTLFKEIAFGCAVAGAVETPKLVEIGKEMVKRCGGLPLAVIFLGSLMRSRKTEEQWNIIKNTKLWHEYGQEKNSEILPSLKLSYDNLPFHLKVCFSYCCLFPKDWIIRREKLVRLWMAEGFIIESPEETALSMEEIGNGYFQSLLSGFFFQDVEKNKDGDIATCKMHDLVHDLARSVVGKNECLIVENVDDIGWISEETRRLNLLVDLQDKEILSKILESLKKAKKLRTVLVESQRGQISFDIEVFKKNKRLRVLDLSRFSVLESIYSIGRLKHLRYLVARGAHFPKGMIGRLSFLQTLSEFKVADKKKNKNAGGSIEELEGLNLLSGDGLKTPGFRIYDLENVTSEIDARRANLKEKKNLSRLNLSWCLYDFDVDCIDLCWCLWGEEKSFLRFANNAEAVLEGLQPHPNLRSLRVDCFCGSKLPRWMGDSSCLPNLVKLVLYYCECEQVVGVGGLPSLRSLKLWGLNLKCIGNEFYYSTAGKSLSSAGGGGGEESRSSTASGETSTAAAATTTIAFPSLKKLTLSFMYALEEWVVPAVPSLSTTGATTNCFPLLEKITIDNCSQLTIITQTTVIFPSLKVFNLKYIDGSVVETLVTNNLKSLTSLKLAYLPNLRTLPRQGLLENNNTLLSLHIERCRKLEGFFPPNNEEEGHDDDEGGGDGGGGGGQQLQQISQEVSSSSSSSSLRSLKLYDCPAMRYYPDFRSLTSLQTLTIQECKESESLLTRLSSSSSSSLEHLEFVQIVKTDDGSTSAVSKWRKSSSFQGMKH